MATIKFNNNTMKIYLPQNNISTIVRMLNYTLDMISEEDMDLLNTTKEEMEEAYKDLFDQYIKQLSLKVID